MVRPAKITTPFPTVLETAKRLGVSKRDVRFVLELVERSVRTGALAAPGPGRPVRPGRKAGTGRNSATGNAIQTPAKKVVKSRAAKTAKGTNSPPKKK